MSEDKPVIVVGSNPSTRDTATADIVVIGRRVVKHRRPQMIGLLLDAVELDMLKRGVLPHRMKGSW